MKDEVGKVLGTSREYQDPFQEKEIIIHGFLVHMNFLRIHGEGRKMVHPPCWLSFM